MKKEKKGQFYLIAAGIIVFIIISLGAITNYVYVRSEPQKFYDIGDVLGREGVKVIEYAQFNKQNINQTVNRYLEVYEDYLDTNLNTDFDLIIFYGNITDEKINAKRYTRSSMGQVTISLGQGVNARVAGGSEVIIRNEQAQVTTDADGRNVNVTLKPNQDKPSINMKVPVLPDNNFVFVMTTSDEFNRYIQTSFQQENPTTSTRG
jgi:hypothetical protein